MESKSPSFWKQHWRKLVAGYLGLLLASHLAVFFSKKGSEEEPAHRVLTEDGLVIAYSEWGERVGVPLILSHGSPGGGGSDFEVFARELAKERWVIAPDRWGFGQSTKDVDDYSFIADAEAIATLMAALEIPEVDAMGWSYGGGVVLELARRHPDSVRSLGLLGAIGIQEGEGSGSYAVEQAKYFLMKLAVVALPEVVPHFGLAGDRMKRRAFVRDFQDADMRPMRGLMESLEKPVLIVHGEDDPMVPAWVAQEHHRLLGNSRLVVLEGSHFFPMGGEGVEAAVEEVNSFLNAVALGGKVNGESYESRRTNMKALWPGGPSLRGWKPWWLVLLVSGVLAWRFPRTTVFLAGCGGSLLLFDGLLALGAVLLVLLGERFFGKEPTKRRPRWKRFLLVVDFLAGSVLGGLLLRLG
ncbi:alpha/beta fold hydrolase [Roseibacillus persicicus]|uniref:alpha/beta fold hydrolase n=1 Tax=Roseibacillus persicicus TaxID=454148 RepID=UPI00280C768E|nr:alpha/beta hydrolase [Roseibacillus persicicus]MDQ8191739.1 alpha/beta hydrolase [Roseibacillus persicicus]